MSIDQHARTLFSALKAREPFSRISDSTPTFAAGEAYAIQQQLVALLTADGQQIAGYKAALTAPQAQAAMNSDQPITGVLWRQGRRESGVRLGPDDMSNLVLETELGFTLNADVSSHVTDVAQLQALTATVQPMVELAKVGFGDQQPNGLDLIAANSASNGYIPGPEIDWQQRNLNNIQVELIRDGESQHQTLSGTVMTDQWQALLWLVNTVVDQGYTIHPKQFLMTGSIGGLHPGVDGTYEAIYQDLATIQFTIVS